MKLDKLRQKNLTDAETLKALCDRIRKNTSAAETPVSDLERTRANVANLRSEMATLSSASSLQLYQRNLTVEQAAKRVDEINAEIQPLENKEAELEGSIAKLRSQIETDHAAIGKMLEPWMSAVELQEQAENCALLCSIVDGARLDIPYEMSLGRFDLLFPSTVVAGILNGRRAAISNAKKSEDPRTALLSVLDEILADPIPELAANPAELPDNPNAAIVQSITKVLAREW